MFKSFLQGGFECSTHRRKDGKRLDLIAATRHDVFALEDYRALADLKIWTVRDGVRWHVIEARPRHYDFSSVVPMLRAAQTTGTQAIWDLHHFGWPDDIDIFSAEFVQRFGQFASAFATLLKNETDGTAFICPVNEMSFLSWAGGETAYVNPFATGRGSELKTQLVLATIAAIQAIRGVLPGARIVICEPAIHIVASPLRPQDKAAAEGYRLSQFQALDMLTGKISPQLHGRRDYGEIIGVNYYSNNQWIDHGRTLQQGDPLYRPFREILREFYDRYGRPLFVSETGIEGDRRPAWLTYVADEVMAARESGVPVEGICLYPMVNHPGWDDDRHCHNGVLDYPGRDGHREMYEPLAREIEKQRRRFSPENLLAQAANA
ncbi:MAG: beta-glucosidase [Bryobacteraceae bacterium]